ncbi:hypothetical protein PIB30_060334 [Stylosanthes scabra]|uniref:Uncharacterized protein n=1 Tax=Stylosanthes scabra TaxID=79078 RepID=A0ABU6WKF6_9FABA|nr:hypothetical protein [Stylosanthes scabra]
MSKFRVCQRFYRRGPYLGLCIPGIAIPGSENPRYMYSVLNWRFSGSANVPSGFWDSRVNWMRQERRPKIDVRDEQRGWRGLPNKDLGTFASTAIA